MDLPCINCGEPWDMDYVLHDAPHEFTRTHGRIDRCPACPATGRPPLSVAERERLAVVAELADILGPDIDGLVAELEALGSSSGGDTSHARLFLHRPDTE